MCNGAAFLEVGGVLPVGGGWADQSASFLDALAIVLKDKAKYDEVKQKLAAAKSGR